MNKRILLLFILFCWLRPVLYAQSSGKEIHFGKYGSYSLMAGTMNNDPLDFGAIISGSGVYNVDINNAKVISVTGVEYLDVIVTVDAQPDLYLNGDAGNAGDAEKSIPFTLKAAYANNKGVPNIGAAKFINNISNNTFTTRFPILERQAMPPGPPPPPPTNAFEQSKVEETAYLYLYGSLNVGNVNAGTYSSEIEVTISYFE
jgi:hypothetical protein